MKLDPKIKVKKIFDVFSDFEEVKKYYGKEVYCADFIENFSNIDRYTNTFIFKEFYLQEFKPFVCGGQQYRFILPCEFVDQEKQYRPYTLNEFLDKYIICANIRIRQKDRTCQYFGKLIGYQFPTDPNTGKQKGDNDAVVCIGGYNFKLIELFTDYEQYDNMKDIWVPCGVEVEE